MPFETSVHFHGIEYVAPTEISKDRVQAYTTTGSLVHLGLMVFLGSHKNQFHLEKASRIAGRQLNSARIGLSDSFASTIDFLPFL